MRGYGDGGMETSVSRYLDFVLRSFVGSGLANVGHSRLTNTGETRDSGFSREKEGHYRLVESERSAGSGQTPVLLHRPAEDSA